MGIFLCISLSDLEYTPKNSCYHGSNLTVSITSSLVKYGHSLHGISITLETLCVEGPGEPWLEGSFKFFPP